MKSTYDMNKLNCDCPPKQENSNKITNIFTMSMQTTYEKKNEFVNYPFSRVPKYFFTMKTMYDIYK